jgi:hypothetical protein
MKKYVVISLYVGGKNKVFSSGDVVTQDNFETEIETLERQGFLKAMDVALEPKKETVLSVLADVIDAPEKDVVETRIPKFLKEDGTPVFDIDDCSANEIRTELTRRKIEFKSNASKGTLFGLL